MPMYWEQAQEDAIKEYIITKDIELKEVIFEKRIQPVFKKLVENIYYTYSFHKSINDFSQVEQDAISHLYEKLHKFNPNMNTKAFSYFGTVTKRFMLQRMNKNKNKVSLDTDHNYSNYITFDSSTKLYNDDNNIKALRELLKTINENLDLSNESGFNEDDLAVIEIIRYIIDDYKKISITNKKQLYVYLKEATRLPTRKITKTITKLKTRYQLIKKDFIEGE